MKISVSRWYVLFTFSLFSYIQGAVWMTFSCVPKDTQHDYHVKQDQIDLLLNWGPIIFVVIVPVTTWLLTKQKGFNRAAFLGYSLTFAGSVVRAIPSVVPGNKGLDLRRGRGGIAFLHIGQILNAAGGPIAMGAASRMSSEWFPEGQRTRPTAVVFVSNALGVAVTFIVGPYIVRWTSLAVLLYLIAGLSAIPFICCLIHFPTPPGERLVSSDQRKEENNDLVQSTSPMLPDQRESVHKAAFLAGLKATLTNYSAMVLCIGNGIMGGVVNAYLGVLPSALNDAGRSELQGDRLTSINTFAGIMGGIFLADLTDRFFQRYMKDMLIFILVTSFFFLSGLVYTVLLRPDLYWLQYLFAFMAGLFQGARDPLTAEFAAELSYPADEGTSAGLYTTVFNLSSVILIFVAPYSSVIWLGVATLASTLVALLLVSTIREVYRRRDTLVNYTVSVQTGD